MSAPGNVFHHLTPIWSESPMVDTRSPVAKIARRPDGVLEVIVCFDIMAANEKKRLIMAVEAAIGPSVRQSSLDPRAPAKMVTWGLRQLAGSVWTVEPWVTSPFGISAYVTIWGVPEPVPFLLKKEGETSS
jgi:hypothetical protein